MPALAEQSLVDCVQYNCDLSDARYGADFSLCVYLMKMREYFRWERGIAFGVHLPKEEVGDWLQAREERWDSLEEAEERPLSIAGQDYDAYDAEGINAALSGRGLVYSSGLGNGGKPHFFLAQLERHERIGDCEVFVAGQEYARDLAAPPAMTQGRTIFLRRESLQRLLWEKLESWRWNRPDNALGRAFACYDFDGDLEGSLAAMADREIANILLHEQGEYEAGLCLDDAAWNALLLAFIRTPAEMMLRALRDHLADCLVTLPRLVEQGDAAALHFHQGNLTPLRRSLFPALVEAYARWESSGDSTAILAAAEQGVQHWRELGRSLVQRHQQGALTPGEVRAEIEGHPL